MLLLLDTNIHTDWVDGKLDEGGVAARLARILSHPEVGLVLPIVQFEEFRWRPEKQRAWTTLLASRAPTLLLSDEDIAEWEVRRLLAEVAGEPVSPTPFYGTTAEEAGRFLSEVAGRARLLKEPNTMMATARRIGREARQRRADETKTDHQDRLREDEQAADRFFADPKVAAAMVRAVLEKFDDQEAREEATRFWETHSEELAFLRPFLEQWTGFPGPEGLVAWMKDVFQHSAAAPVNLGHEGLRHAATMAQRLEVFRRYVPQDVPAELLKEAERSIVADPWRCPALEIRVQMMKACDRDLQGKILPSDTNDFLLVPWVTAVDYLTTDSHMADAFRKVHAPPSVRGKVYGRREFGEFLSTLERELSIPGDE